MSRPLYILALWVVVTLQGGCAARPSMPESFAATPPDLVADAGESNGAIYQSNHDAPLFYNSVARHVGDVLTITLQEATNASKSAITTTKKASSAALPGVTLAGLPLSHNGANVLSGSMSNASAFDGEGNSTQSNKLTGDISVTIAKRYNNGNLLVRGEKWISINQGREFVRVQGIVRPVDILPDNSVPSYRLADAKISYGGQGTLSDSNTKSWLARFFDSPWMPF